jgi:3-phosphoshikimate 1-carboxyvinyltransferase
MLGAIGAPITVEPLPGGGRRVAVRGPAPLPAARFAVPGDFSAAAFFLAAAAATPGASVTATGVSLNPTRTGLLEVLERMGATVRRASERRASGEEVGDVTVTGPERLRAVDVPADWVPRLIDEVPAWTIAAARAEGRSRLAGARELRVKETDRIAALTANLGRLGVAAAERPDGLEIDGGPVRGGVVRAERDHRIAMAFALLGTLASGPVRIEEAETIATSFPGFLEACAVLGADVSARSGR